MLQQSRKNVNPFNPIEFIECTPHPKADLQRVFIRQLQITGSTLGTQDEFRALMLAVEQGQLAPAIDRVFPFDQAMEALDHLDQRRQFGKLVVKVTAPFEGR